MRAYILFFVTVFLLTVSFPSFSMEMKRKKRFHSEEGKKTDFVTDTLDDLERGVNEDDDTDFTVVVQKDEDLSVGLANLLLEDGDFEEKYQLQKLCKRAIESDQNIKAEARGILEKGSGKKGLQENSKDGIKKSLEAILRKVLNFSMQENEEKTEEVKKTKKNWGLVTLVSSIGTFVVATVISTAVSGGASLFWGLITQTLCDDYTPVNHTVPAG